jgi:hypothetical protein
VQTSAADRLKTNKAHRHARTLEAMRTQAFSEETLCNNDQSQISNDKWKISFPSIYCLN